MPKNYMLNKKQRIKTNYAQISIPMDVYFGVRMQYLYIAGMSVPPVMMAQVASRVYEQWLSKINQRVENVKPSKEEPIQLTLF